MCCDAQPAWVQMAASVKVGRGLPNLQDFSLQANLPIVSMSLLWSKLLLTM